MIKSALIKRFQSWDDVLLEFVPGVNVIIGVTDKGKSSLIRAIRWPIINRPTGEGMHSNWLSRGEETSSTLLLDNGEEDHVVTRFKSKSKNLYLMNSQEFLAPGLDVPEEIQKILNFSDINVQLQTESFFLIDYTSGEVARYLNRVVDLEEIDGSLAYAMREVRGHRKLVEGTRNEIQRIQGEIDDLSWVKDAEERWKRLDAESRAIGARKGKLVQLDTLLHRISQARGEVEKYSGVPEMQKKLSSLLDLFSSIQERTDLVLRIVRYVQEISQARERVERYRDVPEMRKRLNDLLSLHDTIQERQRRKDRLDHWIKEIIRTRNWISQKTEELEELEEEFHEAFPDRCPLCGKEK